MKINNLSIRYAERGRNNDYWQDREINLGDLDLSDDPILAAEILKGAILTAMARGDIFAKR